MLLLIRRDIGRLLLRGFSRLPCRAWFSCRAGEPDCEEEFSGCQGHGTKVTRGGVRRPCPPAVASGRLQRAAPEGGHSRLWLTVGLRTVHRLEQCSRIAQC